MGHCGAYTHVSSADNDNSNGTACGSSHTVVHDTSQLHVFRVHTIPCIHVVHIHVRRILKSTCTTHGAGGTWVSDFA